MIDALITGKLHAAPTQRTSRNGNTFTTAKVRVPTGDDTIFCNAICFDERAQAALLALDTGEAVALAGTLKVGVWQAKDGTTKPSLDVTVSQVLTTYSITKKRRAAQGDQDDAKAPRRQQVEPDFDDGEMPF